MANELSTAGITIGYAVETTAGTRPTSFTNIPNIKSIGDMNPDPATYDVTDLSDTVWKRYIDGLKDPGGAVALTANITQSFITTWASICSAATTGKAENKSTWFCVTVPNITEKFYFAGMPQALGLPQIETDAVFEGDVYVVPNQIAGWVGA